MDAERAIAILAERQHGVVTRRAAVSMGFTARMIDSRVAAGRWEVLHRGVYRLSGSPRTWHQRLTAASLATGPGAVASHRAAAMIWSIPWVEGRIELTVPERRRVTLPGVTVHRAVCLASADIKRVDGIRVTSVARTVIDLAGVLAKAQLELVLDHALSHGLVSLAHVRRRLQQLGRPGRSGAGDLAALLDARPSGPRLPQSEFELQLLRALTRRRLPTPKCQHLVRLANGRRAFLDFAYPDALLAIEADSYRHHSSLSDWSRDRVRNNELVALGWRILPVTAVDLRARPEAVADQIARALASGARIGRLTPLSGVNLPNLESDGVARTSKADGMAGLGS